MPSTVATRGCSGGLLAVPSWSDQQKTRRGVGKREHRSSDGVWLLLFVEERREDEVGMADDDYQQTSSLPLQ